MSEERRGGPCCHSTYVPVHLALPLSLPRALFGILPELPRLSPHLQVQVQLYIQRRPRKFLYNGPSDFGATDNFIDAVIVRALRIHVQQEPMPDLVETTDGTCRQTMMQGTTQLEAAIQGHREALQFTIRISL